MFKVVVQYSLNFTMFLCKFLLYSTLFFGPLCIFFVFPSFSFFPNMFNCYFLIFFSSVNPTCTHRFQISTFSFSALHSFCVPTRIFSVFFPVMFRSGRELAWSEAQIGLPKSRTMERASSERSYSSPKPARATTRSRWFGTQGENCATEQGMMGNTIYLCMIPLQLVRYRQ